MLVCYIKCYGDGTIEISWAQSMSQFWNGADRKHSGSDEWLQFFLERSLDCSLIEGGSDR